MSPIPQTPCTAFDGCRRIASGALIEVALKVKEHLDRHLNTQILIFDDMTSRQIEVDFRGTADEVLTKITPAAPETAPNAAGDIEAAPVPRGPGRPKLGVVAREVTLLPRHWDWLSTQPGGASVVLRKLVEEARRTGANKDRVRQAQEASYRFMTVLAGNESGFEEATRALFAGDRQRFDKLVAPWPADVRDHARKLAAAAFLNADTR